MNQEDLDEYIFLKIVAYESIAKCISILSSREIIANLIESHEQTEREVEEDIERELAEDEE